MNAILSIKSVSKTFGGIRAVDNVSFDVMPADVMGLIGPNGSGKTTLFNMIMNIIKTDGGKIYFKDVCINNLALHRVVSMGISRTFQTIRLFKRLTVLENMNVSCLCRRTENWQKKALELLEGLNLISLKDSLAENLSYGQQKLLEFGMALMPDPDFIMLDEPTSGINPNLQETLMKHIFNMRATGKTFLIVEHNMPFVGRICNRVVVLDHGQKIAEGEFGELRKDENVLNAYLGGSD